MISKIKYNGIEFKVDLSKPIDISIPMRAGEKSVSAWYVSPVKIEPVRTESFVGSVKEGGSVNFRDIMFNPHGHGTHTECVGHISKEDYSINQCLKQFFFLAELISVQPQSIGEDKIITKEQIENALSEKETDVIIIRTLPNDDTKLRKQYSNTNPPYLHHDAAKFIRDSGIKHLLIDLPSVDREVDEGKLLAHKAFWEYPENPQTDMTITELIYVPNEIDDGSYLLNIQFASFENDASPSKPVLYVIETI
ncbi:MAG: metal-dependent hydrolase [Flavobacteriales bacterium]|nr:MAG: metal-dependent hydrolase [Flavobacteriales bacterium]